MPYQFYVQTIQVLEVDVHEDFPKGTPLATMSNGEVFKHTPPWEIDLEDLFDPRVWPEIKGKGIRLARDYWTYIYNIKDRTATGPERTPYYMAVYRAPKRTIR